MRRIAAVAAVLAGLVLIATPIASSLFSRSKSAQQLADGVRTAMTKQALAADRSSLELLRGALSELNGPPRSRLARALGQSPQQFSASITSFPDVAAGLRELPRGFVPHSGRVLSTLEQNRTRFETADDFPIGGVSARVGPWLFLALGVALVAAGVAALLTRGRGALVAVLALGLVPFVSGLALSLPHKASATDQLVDNLQPAFSARTTGRVPGELATGQKFAHQTEAEFVPALEGTSGLSPEHFDAAVRGSAPHFAQALPRFTPIVANFTALGTALVNDRHVFKEAAKIPSRTLVWLLLGATFVVLVLAAAALVTETRRSPAAGGPA